MSELTLDGGTFRRTGEAMETMTADGGGKAMFGSYNDDNNLERFGHQATNGQHRIKNGGRLRTPASCGSARMANPRRIHESTSPLTTVTWTSPAAASPSKTAR